jgi:Na+/proline symporter
MTGMDQEMMQKNISVRTLRDSQKNVVTLGIILLLVVLLFLFLGGLLYLYGESVGGQFSADHKSFLIQSHDATGDRLFPVIALNYLPPLVSVIFIIALISALFPSADGAITALTSSFCIDILGIQRQADKSDAEKKKTRQRVHLVFAVIFLLFVMVYKWVNSPSMITVILKVAAYTYGPLLGLFAFGILTRRRVSDNLVPIVCVIAPIICFIIDKYQKAIFGSFEIGLELIIINGLLTFIGLLFVSKKESSQ